MAAVNDATKQKIGDIYQYFIALFDCFSLKKGESMLIETEGDVSIVSHSGQNRVQKEIKHHLGKRNLSDRDEDYWNTLDNWCKNKHSTATFEKLIFYTTSGISKNSACTAGNIASHVGSHHGLSQVVYCGHRPPRSSLNDAYIIV